MAATYTSNKSLNLLQKGVIAFITVVAAVVMLFINIVISPGAMVLGTLAENDSLLSSFLTVFGGATPGMLIAYVIYRLFASNRFKSLGLSLFAIIPITCFWLFFSISYSSSAVSNWIAVFNVISQIGALIFIYIKVKDSALSTSKKSKYETC